MLFFIIIIFVGKAGRNCIPQETRYAITRVTKYDDYTTYEILKSTRAKPKKIPEVLEKIFVEKDFLKWLNIDLLAIKIQHYILCLVMFQLTFK